MRRLQPLQLLARCPVWDGLDGGVLIVACSGGRDSVALALAAQELLMQPRFRQRFTTPPELILWHLDHGLRPDSADDRSFVEQLARRLGLRCRTERAELAEELARNGGNMEALAREERYRRLGLFLAGQRGGTARAVTAHHLGDQVETILHHLIRGTRLAGLRGIAPQLGARIYRPWLALPPETIQAYIDDHGQDYCNDPGNADLQLTRGRLRCEIIPALCRLNPAAREHIARLAGMAREACELKQGMADSPEIEELDSACWLRWLPLYSRPEGSYSVLRHAKGWLASGQLAAFIDRHAGLLGISRAGEQLDTEAWAARPAGTLRLGWLRYELPAPDLLVCLSRTKNADDNSVLRLMPHELQAAACLHASLVAADEDEARHWCSRSLQPWERIQHWEVSLPALLSLPGASAEWRCYLPEQVALPLALRCWRHGDRIRLAGGGMKKLGDIFTDAKIPAGFRNAWAVLTDADDQVLWLPALADSEVMQISAARPARWVVTLRSVQQASSC